MHRYYYKRHAYQTMEVVKIEIERRIALEIMDEFEKLLASKGIKIPSEDRDPERYDEACLYGREYCELEDSITDLLKAQHFSIKEALKLTDDQASKITVMMHEIARKMADDYCKHLFWDSLQIIAEIVFEREGIEFGVRAKAAGFKPARPVPERKHGA